ncbi:MAG: adenosine deaminase [Ilumatobacteraceae bacterium]
MTRPWLAKRLLLAMPKAELHLHLDGCLRPVTAIELARERGVAAPQTYTDMFEALVAAPGTGSHENLLRCFDLPISLMQDVEALTRVTTELVEDKAADRVAYMEIKWAPALHCNQGLSLDDVVNAVALAAADASHRFGVVVTLTAVGLRSDPPHLNTQVADAAVRHRSLAVTGFDLAGAEEHHLDPVAHAAAFERAGSGGLGLTVHVGELADGGALVRRALELSPQRLAHGVTVASDPQLIDEIIARGITLDLCPTSNVQSGAVTSIAAHPLAILHRSGVKVTINTDDTTISNITLSEELHSCHVELGMTLAEIWRCNLNAVEAGFVDADVKATLHRDFQRWAEHIPELSEATSTTST